MVFAEKDLTGNGAPDAWYSYEQGRLSEIRRDTTGDGSADVWEIYGENQQLLKRSKDLDYDGVADIHTEPGEEADG